MDNTVETATALLEKAKEAETAGKFQEAIDNINQAATILVELGAWGEEEIITAQNEVARLQALLNDSETTQNKEISTDAKSNAVTSTDEGSSTQKTVENGTFLLEQAKEEENAGNYQAAIEKINAAAAILVEQGAWGEDEIITAQLEVTRLQELLKRQIDENRQSADSLKSTTTSVQEQTLPIALSNQTKEFAMNLLKDAKKDEEMAQFQAAIDKINQAATILVELNAWGQDEIINAQEEVARLQGLLDSKSAIDKLSAMNEDGLEPVQITQTQLPASVTPTSPAPPQPTIKPPIPTPVTPTLPATPPTPKRNSFDEGLPDLPIAPSQKIKLAAMKIPKMDKPIIPPPEEPAVPTPVPAVKETEKKLVFTPPSEIPQDADSVGLGEALSFHPSPEPITNPPVSASPNEIPAVPPRPNLKPPNTDISNNVSNQPPSIPSTPNQSLPVPEAPNLIPIPPPRIPSEPNNLPPEPEAPNLIPISPPKNIPVIQPEIPSTPLEPLNIMEKRDPLGVLTQKSKDKIGFEEANTGSLFGGVAKPIDTPKEKPSILLFGQPKPKSDNKSVLSQLESKLHTEPPKETSTEPASNVNKPMGLARLKAVKSGSIGSNVKICPMCGKMADKCKCGYMKKIDS